jgi:hypothetical protein
MSLWTSTMFTLLCYLQTTSHFFKYWNVFVHNVSAFLSEAVLMHCVNQWNFDLENTVSSLWCSACASFNIFVDLINSDREYK